MTTLHRIAADVTSKGLARKHSGTLACLSAVVKNSGLAGLYRGFGVALLGVVVFKSLFLGGYDICKIVLDLEPPVSDRNVPRKSSLPLRYIVAQVKILMDTKRTVVNYSFFFFNQALTTVVGTACYPLDTVRRRMMMQVILLHPL